jgi:hypothetical protein
MFEYLLYISIKEQYFYIIDEDAYFLLNTFVKVFQTFV